MMLLLQPCSILDANNFRKQETCIPGKFIIYGNANNVSPPCDIEGMTLHLFLSPREKYNFQILLFTQAVDFLFCVIQLHNEWQTLSKLYFLRYTCVNSNYKNSYEMYLSEYYKLIFREMLRRAKNSLIYSG